MEVLPYFTKLRFEMKKKIDMEHFKVGTFLV